MAVSDWAPTLTERSALFIICDWHAISFWILLYINQFYLQIIWESGWNLSFFPFHFLPLHTPQHMMYSKLSSFSFHWALNSSFLLCLSTSCTDDFLVVIPNVDTDRFPLKLSMCKPVGISRLGRYLAGTWDHHLHNGCCRGTVHQLFTVLPAFHRSSNSWLGRVSSFSLKCWRWCSSVDSPSRLQ